jgi:arylsulfatase
VSANDPQQRACYRGPHVVLKLLVFRKGQTVSRCQDGFHVSRTHVLVRARDEDGGHCHVRDHSDHHCRTIGRHGRSARGNATGLSLKPLGYAAGQFGKNHLGDRNEFLPTVHGFDEFYGNLYHLNAEEEPELPDYPKDPAFRAKYGPRGVMDCKASDKDDTTVDPRFGKVGKRVCRDTGPLTRERMLTIDDDIAERAVDFIRRQKSANKPFFSWVNFTHMHFRTHTKPQSIGQSGRFQSPYHDAMIDHDKNVGSVLKALDDLGIADNTFVMYGTDNGPHMNSWPDAGMTPFRSEKNSNWEGAYRVPAIFRWPGRIKAGMVSNEMVSHLDMLPTILAIAGDPQVTNKVPTQ